MSEHNETNSVVTIFQAKQLALKAAAERWPDAPMTLKAIFSSREHLREQGRWLGVSDDIERFMYFSITGTYIGFGSSPVVEVDLQKGMARYAFSVGE